MERIREYLTGFLGLGELLSPVYVVTFVMIGWAWFKYRHIRGSFWAYLFPKAIWSHESTRADLSLFALGQLMVFFRFGARFPLHRLSRPGSRNLVPDR